MSATPPKHARAAAIVRAPIADATLKPGSPAPSGDALARATGYSALTCRKTLRALITEGILRPGPSPNARPRVAGADPACLDLAARAAALSGALAGRRRAAGDCTGYAVTPIGHAGMGRLWQSRTFWETADKTLNAGGVLLRLHDDYGEALTHPAPVPVTAETTVRTDKSPAPASVTINVQILYRHQKRQATIWATITPGIVKALANDPGTDNDTVCGNLANAPIGAIAKFPCIRPRQLTIEITRPGIGQRYPDSDTPRARPSDRDVNARTPKL